MLKAQQIYGPHHEAQWAEGPLAIGRRLFRLLPEDVHDRGPVIGDGGNLVLTADIRIDNIEKLRAELPLEPAMSDTAILMRALERWGEDALDRVVGDFAFALWNRCDRSLLLARDCLGQRPLHYHVGDGIFAFASMPKGLHGLPEVPYAPRVTAVADFLALMPETGPETYFEGVNRVLPGHVLKITRAGLAPRRYWRPSRAPIRLARAEDYEDALRDHLDTAVRSRLRGTGGTVASHLSAGLDSSAVTATAARLGSRVVAFTAVPEEDGPVPRGRIGDEGPIAATVAALHPGVEHVRIATGSRSPFEALDRDFFLFERPMLNLCNTVWAREINAEAQRRGLNVLLIGTMGNMSFSHAGMQRLPELLRSGRLWRLARLARAANVHGLAWKSIAAATLGPYLPRLLWARLRSSDLFDHTALRVEAVEDHGIRTRAAARDLDPSYRPWADSFAMRKWALSRVDPGVYNKGTLAGWGIDTRDPSGDRRLVEFCLRVPDEQFILGGVPRSLARRAFADRLPPEPLRERRKGYQAADWHVGLSAARSELADTLERLAGCQEASGIIDLPKLRQRVDNWPTGGWDEDETIRHYRLALLRGVAAGHFLHKASRTN